MKKVGWLLLLILPLAACGPSQSPDEVVAEFWQHTTALEIEQANQLLGAEMQADPEAITQFAQGEGQERLLFEAVFAKMSAEPREPEVDGDTAVVMVEVAGPDMQAVARSVMLEGFGMALGAALGGMSDEQMEQQINQMIIRELNSDSVPLSRNLVEHQLIIEDGEWKISAIDEEALGQVFGMPEAALAP